MKYDKYYTLKLIAIISMLADHIACLFINSNLPAYTWMRGFGRLAFPIFAYLLVTGFNRRKSHHTYLNRLMVLCIISEIPYNLFISGQVIDSTYQNVCFTLTLGYLFLMITDSKQCDKWTEGLGLKKKIFSKALWICLLGVFSLIAYIGHTDYSYKGFLFILILYFIERTKHKKIWLVAGFVFFGLYMNSLMAIYHSLAVIPILILKDKKETVSKPIAIVFRYFYPAHLLVLVLIKGILEVMR